MKLKEILTVVFLTVTVLSLSGVGLTEAANKISYVNLGKVFDEYQKTKDFDEVLEKERKDKQAQREKMVKEIRKLKDALELMSKKAKEKKQTEIDQKIKKLQEFDREVNTELKQKRDSMVREILKEIDTTIQEYGQKEKYDMILDGRSLLYSNDSIDITDHILKILNERYKRKP
jgi:outer membrane protein